MKKVFLSVFIFLMGFPTNVMSQKFVEPSSKVTWTKIGRIYLSSILPKKYANCISMKDKEGNPIDKNGNLIKDGWVVCEDKKLEQFGDYIYQGIFDGVDEVKINGIGYRYIKDSDAVRACASLTKNIVTTSGKKINLLYTALPPKEIFSAFMFMDIQEFKSLPGIQEQSFWTSSGHPIDLNFAYFFYKGMNLERNRSSRNYQDSVRCIGTDDKEKLF